MTDFIQLKGKMKRNKKSLLMTVITPYNVTYSQKNIDTVLKISWPKK